ncbi:hypothetical protein ACFPM0_29280 [Pseudonocardia sulfidoxydans]|uniref:hypothetical protein n=1 Tax=Pseudonocardia sulfidoxydans TaxID=54011 RepID=UPI003606F196
MPASSVSGASGHGLDPSGRGPPRRPDVAPIPSGRGPPYRPGAAPPVQARSSTPSGRGPPYRPGAALHTVIPSGRGADGYPAPGLRLRHDSVGWNRRAGRRPVAPRTE